jgi:hypothetical protein
MDATFSQSQPALSRIIDEIAPKKFTRDPLGFFSGYRAYQVFTHLSGLEDEELRAMGVARGDIPRIASEVISAARRERSA